MGFFTTFPILSRLHPSKGPKKTVPPTVRWSQDVTAVPSATPAASPPPAADGFDEFLYLGAGCGDDDDGDDGDDGGGGGGGGGAFHTPPK